MTIRLQQLMTRKRELEREIRELQCGTTTFGKATCGRETYPTDLPDRWYVAVEATYRNGSSKDSIGRSVKRAIINGTSKKEVIDQIPDIIRDLQGLYDQEKDA